MRDDSESCFFFGSLPIDRFGLGSTLLMLQDRPAAAAELALAHVVFERVFDKLRADGFFLLPPPNCLPGNKEQCTERKFL